MLTVITIVSGVTTEVFITCGAVPCPPSNTTTAPLAKPEPVIVRFTTAPDWVVLGMTPAIVIDDAEVPATARVAVGIGTVGLGSGEGGTLVAVTGSRVGMEVADGRGVKVAAGDTVGETGVNVAAGVKDGVAGAPGMKNAGLPYSRQPRSGAAPVNAVMGVAGTGSPLLVTYCVTPLSIAGEPDCSNSPLKSSSTVPQVPSGPGLGAA